MRRAPCKRNAFVTTGDDIINDGNVIHIFRIIGQDPVIVGKIIGDTTNIAIAYGDVRAALVITQAEKFEDRHGGNSRVVDETQVIAAAIVPAVKYHTVGAPERYHPIGIIPGDIPVHRAIGFDGQGVIARAIFQPWIGVVCSVFNQIGCDDPHRVLMPLKMALMMSDDKDVIVYLDIHAVQFLAKDSKDINFADFESAHTYIKKLADKGVGVYACPTCMKIAGIAPEDLMEGVKVAQKDKFFNFTKGRIIALDY